MTTRADVAKYTSIEQWGTSLWEADMSYAFAGAWNLTMNPNAGTPDMSAVTNMYSMFREATSFNGDISGWNTVAVTSMSSMFYFATSFNQNIGGWNTAKVTYMHGMFNNALSFDQNIGNWNTAQVTTMESMFSDVTLSPTNYDALLTGWDAKNLQTGVIFDGGDSKYSSDVADAARENMVNSDSWTITDGGRIQLGDAPTAIFLSSTSIAENAGSNTVVGTLSTNGGELVAIPMP